MYTITVIEELGKRYVVLSNVDLGHVAKICLNEGGRLSNFSFNHMEILAEQTLSNYKEDFASAILFPFANRVKNGEYVFDNVHRKLVCNEKTKDNAIHGLVFDKFFRYTERVVNSNNASASFIYNESEGCDGFPFKYELRLKYTLNNTGVFLEVTVKNEDDKSFPFTLGWHPYFLSTSLKRSKLKFDSDEIYISDPSGIVIGKKQHNQDKPISIGNRKFDDAYKVHSSDVRFMTPNYQVQLKSSAPDNFLQIYTPNSMKALAIEPMTGVSDSFNNNIGKKILKPKEVFRIEWQVRITGPDQINHN